MRKGKNGLRFASQQLIQEFYMNNEGEELIVETEIKYK